MAELHQITSLVARLQSVAAAPCAVLAAPGTKLIAKLAGIEVFHPLRSHADAWHASFRPLRVRANTIERLKDANRFAPKPPMTLERVEHQSA